MFLQKVGLGPELGSLESLASLRIASLEQIVEEVTTIRVFSEVSPLGELGFAVGHILSSAFSNVGEHVLVNAKLVDDGHGGAEQVSGSGQLNQLKSESVLGRFQQVERLSVTQVSKDIHGKIIEPLVHVSRSSPSLGFGGVFAGRGANYLTEGPHVGKDILGDLTDGTIRESLAQNTSLSSVQLLIPSVVGVCYWVGKSIVERSFDDIGLEAINVL